MKEMVFQLSIEEWKRCELALRNGRGIPGMGITEVEKGGRKYCSLCGEP